MEAPLILTCCLAALLLYSNTLHAQFAYDDSRAIKTNPDVLPSTPILQLFWNDFWGTPLTHSGSHKSYRPLTVLSFRLNYALAEFEPFAYHITNVILHVIATGLFAVLTSLLAPNARLFSFTAPLLFAAHPIHSEAVSGVVGRADVGAAIFLLLALLSYIQYCKKSSINGHSNATSTAYYSSAAAAAGAAASSSKSFSSAASANASSSSSSSGATGGCGGVVTTAVIGASRACSPKLYLSLAVLFSALSMLTKELGITALAVCAAHHIFVHAKIRLKDLPSLIWDKRQHQQLWSAVAVLAASGALLLGARLVIMGALPPEFAPADNPAADCDSAMVRGLTFLFLPAFNLWLLLCPATLSFDWSMEAVPLVTTLADPRNLASLSLYGGLAALCLTYLTGWRRPWGGSGVLPRRLGFDDSSNAGDDVVILALALLVLPFLPATNLFFYVGFVVAERILYIPSMGVCLLVSWGIHVLHLRARSTRTRRLLYAAVAILFVLFAARTWRRNQDWSTEENLYRSGIPINPPKAFGNLANILSSQGKKEEAEWAYKKALSYRSNMADVHYNLGILFQEQKRYEESIHEYRLAIQFRPRMAMAHLNLGLVLGLLSRKDEAIEVYRQCSQLDGSGLKDPRTHEATKISALFNLGRLYADDGQYEKAIQVYMEAVDKMPAHYLPQSLYNMLGEAYFKLENLEEAERWYLKALRVKADHVPAHLTYGKLLARMNRGSEAEEWFRKALVLAPKDSSVHQHYGQFLSESDRHVEAADHYVQAAVIAPSEYEIVINAANTLRQAGKNREAEHYYRLAVSIRPLDATSHMNLGAMLHVNGKLHEAEASYLEALRLKPDDSITRTNLQKLRHLLVKKGISPTR